MEPIPRKRIFQPASPPSPAANLSGRHGPSRPRTGSLTTEEIDHFIANYDADYEGNDYSIPSSCSVYLCNP